MIFIYKCIDIHKDIHTWSYMRMYAYTEVTGLGYHSNSVLPPLRILEIKKKRSTEWQQKILELLLENRGTSFSEMLRKSSLFILSGIRNLGDEILLILLKVCDPQHSWSFIAVGFVVYIKHVNIPVNWWICIFMYKMVQGIMYMEVVSYGLFMYIYISVYIYTMNYIYVTSFIYIMFIVYIIYICNFRLYIGYYILFFI